MAPTTASHLSVADSAAYVGVTDKTIRRLIAAGRLPAYRIGTRTIRIRPDDLDALMRPIPTVAHRGGAS